jgi:hypothetical protein
MDSVSRHYGYKRAINVSKKQPSQKSATYFASEGGDSGSMTRSCTMATKETRHVSTTIVFPFKLSLTWRINGSTISYNKEGKKRKEWVSWLIPRLNRYKYVRICMSSIPAHTDCIQICTQMSNVVLNDTYSVNLPLPLFSQGHYSLFFFYLPFSPTPHMRDCFGCCRKASWKSLASE